MRRGLVTPDLQSECGVSESCGSNFFARKMAIKETKRKIKGVKDPPRVTGTRSQGGVGPLGKGSKGFPGFLAQSTRKQDESEGPRFQKSCRIEGWNTQRLEKLL